MFDISFIMIIKLIAIHLLINNDFDLITNFTWDSEMNLCESLICDYQYVAYSYVDNASYSLNQEDIP